jgi:hypothetical protein
MLETNAHYIPQQHRSPILNTPIFLETIKSKVKHKNNTFNQKRDMLLSSNFLSQNITFDSTAFFFPEGFEKIFLILYFTLVPYIFGLIFLFAYIAQSKIDIFLSLFKSHSYILTWCIGYEIVAIIAFLIIFKQAIFVSKKSISYKKRFKRP